MKNTGRFTNVIITSLLACFILIPVNSHAAPLESQRTAFLEAVRLAEQGKPEALAYKKSELRNYVLNPDIEAIYLKATLKQQTSTRIENFLAAYPDQATSNDLLRAYLHYLYKTRQWGKYLENAPAPNTHKTSTKRQCQYLEAQIRNNQKINLQQDALPLWVVNKSQPDECDPIFDVLEKRGLLTEDVINTRIQLTLEQARFKLATHLSGKLPQAKSKNVNNNVALWRKMSADPLTQLQNSLRWQDAEHTQAIVGYGIRKLARIDIDDALPLWEKLEVKFNFPLSEKNSIENYLALRAAYQRHPLTKQAYHGTDPDSMSVREREWQIRSALWERDWQAVLNAIEQMPEKSRLSSQWLYWQARAMAQLGNTTEANAIFTELAKSHGYFQFLAADQIDAEYRFIHKPVIANESIIDALSMRNDLLRAKELSLVNMPGRSRSEWRSVLNRLGDDEKTQAGLLAQRWNLPTSSIQTAVNSAAREDIDIMYPRNYEAFVLKTAERFSLDPAWVFGVIRQESLFMPDVRSSANAYGLMQLLPATAKQTARKNKIRYRGYSQLINPAGNIELGAAYLSEVNRRLQSNPALASAAYNGGPHRVRKWLPASEMPADIWVENIVFNETRNYVQKVLSNKVIYSWRLRGQPLRLKDMMKTVQPLESVRIAQN